jgi:hypothetical protein
MLMMIFAMGMFVSVLLCFVGVFLAIMGMRDLVMQVPMHMFGFILSTHSDSSFLILPANR